MTDWLFHFLLVFSRITAFVVIAPGFSFKRMPVVTKVVISLGLTLTMSQIFLQPIELPQSDWLIYFFLIREILLGLAMGFIVELMFMAIEMAGQMVDFQVGFSMGMAFDPSLGIQASNYGRLYHWLALAVFFSLDYHHLLISKLLESFTIIPVGQVQISGSTIEGVIRLLGESFKLAFVIAAPMLLVALIIDILLGIISRSVSQINVLMLGLPLKIFATFVFMLFFIPNLIHQIEKTLPIIIRYLMEFLTSLGA